MRKITKIGVSASTDSRTPRMLSTLSPTITAASKGSSAECHAGGRKEKIASPAAAIEVVIVNT